MADKYNIVIDQGATWTRQFTWMDAYSNPIDLTDFIITSQIRVAANSPTASAGFSVNIATPPTSGTFLMTLQPSQSAALTGSCYHYDILATSASYVQRIVEGKATIDAAVTR